MMELTSTLTQSKFFSPHFNGAIFDGPLRIYFAQNQESSALKLYFSCMKRLRQDLTLDANLFVLIYPEATNFEAVFGSGVEDVQVDQLDTDFVIAVNGPKQDDDFAAFFRRFDTLMRIIPTVPVTD